MTDSAPPEDASPPAPAARPAASRWAKLWGQLKRFRGPIAAIAAFGAVLSGFLGYWSAYQTVQKVVVPKPAPTVVNADAGPLSIVVLPFQNLTGDANQAYVADGLTASLTADLSRIRDAFIVDAATAFAYKDKPLTAQQVGKDLGVHFVLHGSVQRNGTKIRINAQLADATSNAQLWSDTFRGRPVRSICAARPGHHACWQQHRAGDGHCGSPRERDPQEQPEGGRPDVTCQRLGPEASCRLRTSSNRRTCTARCWRWSRIMPARWSTWPPLTIQARQFL